MELAIETGPTGVAILHSALTTESADHHCVS
jgi:hypothetical protein